MISWRDDQMTGWPDNLMFVWPDNQMTIRWPDDGKLRRRLTVWYIQNFHLLKEAARSKSCILAAVINPDLALVRVRGVHWSVCVPPPPLDRGQFIQRGQCGGWQGFWVMAWIAAANILPIYATHVHSSTSTVKHAENILEFLETILEYDFTYTHIHILQFSFTSWFSIKSDKNLLYSIFLKWWL